MDPQPVAFDDLAPRPPVGPEAEVGLRALAAGIVRHPVATMRALARQPGRRWVWPVVVLAIVTTAAAAAGLPAANQYARAAALAQSQRMLERSPEVMGGQSAEEVAAMTTSGPFAAIGNGIAIVGSLLGVVIAALVAAALLHFLGTALGGQQTYTQMLTTVSWAHAPFVFRELLRLGYHLLGRFDPSPSGLSGLVACQASDAKCVPSLMGPLLAQIEVWNVWYWALLVVGIAVVCHVSRRKATVAVIVLVGLQVLLGLGGVLAARSMSGMFGG